MMGVYEVRGASLLCLQANLLRLRVTKLKKLAFVKESRDPKP